METKHDFWDKMPISKDKNYDININSEIYTLKESPTYSRTPVKLPGKLKFEVLDLDNDKRIDDLITFLNQNYQEINSNLFFQFNKSNILWQLKYPNNFKELNILVTYEGKIQGCIFGIRRKLKIYDKYVDSIETNLLCLNKRLRKLKIAPLLIHELARKLGYYYNINQSIYTTTLNLPNKISQTNYLFRFLNIEKMIKLGFIDENLLNKYSLENLKKFYHKTINHNGEYVDIKNINDNDLKIIVKLLNEKMEKLNLSFIWNLDDFKHFFINENVKCYVVYKDNYITDMISYYIQESIIKENDIMTKIKTANLYYYFNLNNSIEQLVSIMIRDCLNNKIDRIKVLNIMEYQNLTKFNFDEGLNELNFYIWNWKCKPFQNKDIGYFVF